MNPGVDWNGNRKYDPTDIGIDIAIQESEPDVQNDEPIRGRRGGCSTAMLLMLL